MTTIVPKSELARRAMDWISGQCSNQPGEPDPSKHIEAAAVRFNLSPVDVEFLERFYAGGAEGEKLS
ncbi:MAG: hypothetical protein P4L39_03665 [Humidesulfovibrio sp.]|nr:hypothetical protein [Humidesulfovibrio sp.]